MFGKFSASEKSDTDQSDKASKRQYARRSGDHCVSVINGKIYPVENWSMGGFLISADDRLFGVEQEISVVMKFKLRDEILDVNHKAHVVRKSQHRVGLQFAPMPKKVKDGFKQVVDDFVAQSFVNSQAT